MPKLIALCALLLGIVNGASAAIISADLDCDVSNVTLNSVQLLDTTEQLQNGPYNASECVGFLGGNDDAHGLSSPNPNIGELGDGLLNGEGFDQAQNTYYYFPDGAFVEQSDLQDIDGDGDATDPGWIHLANFNAEGAGTTTYGKLGEEQLDIAQLLEFELFDCDNALTACSWRLTTKLDIIEQVQAILGPATFDHLAISIKAGNGGNGNSGSEGGFIVYDFDFKDDIFPNEPGLNNLTPYIFEGTLNTGGMVNKHGGLLGISHLNVWARDPIDIITINRIPEPASLWLMAGALGLLLRKRLAS